MKDIKKVLIIQTAFLGDVILATALVEKIKLFYPSAKIDFLLKNGYESLFEGNPHINKIICFDKSQKWKSIFNTLSEIRKTKYDCVVNCHRHISSGIFTVFSRATQTIGYNKNPLSYLFTHRIRHSFDGIHEVDRNQQLICHFTDKKALRPRLFVGDSKLHTDNSIKYITISPASVWFTKQFPENKWIEFINKLPKTYKIYLLGAKVDTALCHYIQSKCYGDIEIMAGKLSFLESAALMKNAVMNYVNDSAPMHLASAVNAPICAIYCSTLPTFGFGPLSNISHIIQTKESLECRPCGIHGHQKCPNSHFNCAQKIETDKLLSVLNSI